MKSGATAQYTAAELPPLEVSGVTFTQTVTKNTNDGTYDVSVTIPAMAYTSVAIVSGGIAQVTANNAYPDSPVTIAATGLVTFPYTLRFIKDTVEYDTPGLTKLLTIEGNTLSTQVTGVTQATLFFTPTGEATEQSQDIGTITSVRIGQTGTYRMEFITDAGFEFTNELTVESFTASLSAPLAFHHGNFDANDYGDTDIASAAANGRVFADTPPGTYSWGTLDSASSTATGTTYTWTPSEAIAADVLMVAGGGGGGGSFAGGGGAGGVVFSESVGLSGQKTIVVGNGGLGGKQHIDDDEYGLNGSDTLFTGMDTAIGGGGGGAHCSGTCLLGVQGGSGGGGGHGGKGATGTTDQGYAGGDGTNAIGGGGGGAGGKGGNAVNYVAGDGGLGVDKSHVVGTSYGDNGWFASGGGGGTRSDNNTDSSRSGGTASPGGGTDGTITSIKPSDAPKHTGGGGGGAGFSAHNSGTSPRFGGSGGSGIVIIAPPSGPSLAFDGANKLIVENALNRLIHTRSKSRMWQVGQMGIQGKV